MARSHHRKKHKQHLQQFKHSHDLATSPKGKTKAAWIFAIGGAIVGFIVSYFGTAGAILWMAIGLVAGSSGGYWIGHRIDEQKTR